MNQETKCAVRRFGDGARECRTCGAFASPGTTLLCRLDAKLVAPPGAATPQPEGLQA